MTVSGKLTLLALLLRYSSRKRYDKTQVYTSFIFGDLEGIIRPLLTGTLTDENSPEWTLGTEKACNLEEEDLPSPEMIDGR